MPFSSIPVEKSNRGTSGAAVFIQDQTTPTLSTPFLNTRTSVTLASAPAINQNIISLEPGHGVVDGEIIEMALAGTQKFMQSEVVSVSVNDITLDQPVNQAYQTTDIIVVSSNNLLVDGGSTPVVFSVLPLPTQSGDMVRMILELRGGANQVMDFSKFGSDAALTNGCVLRVNHGDGTYTNKFNFKSNSDFIKQGFDHGFLTPQTGNTITGFISRVTWGGQSKHGVVIRLDGAAGEALELVIQDNLSTTNNTRFNLGAQGHELQG